VKDLSHLSIVVPIGDMAGRLSNLYAWIQEIAPYKPKIILVTSTLFKETLAEVLLNKTTGELPNCCQVVSGEFSNPGDSRNAGLEEVETNWVTFWDSDDLPNVANVIKIMTSGIIEENDFIIADFEVQNAITKQIQPKLTTTGHIDNMIGLALSPGLWRWFIRKNQIKTNPFPALRMGEDQVFLVSTQFWEKRFKFVEPISYTYVTNQQNQLTSSRDAISDLRYSMTKIIEVIRESQETFPEIVGCRMIVTMIKKGTIDTKIHSFVSLARMIRHIGVTGVTRTMVLIYRMRLR